jgi:F-type H+-transporting ATPase subunit b
MAKRFFALAAVLVAPVVAHAEGLHHSTEFVMRRDGAWIVNFLILFAGLLWIIVRFLVPALQKRSEDLAAAMELAEKTKREATDRLAELEAKLREFETATARIRRDAQDQGDIIKARIIADANAAAARILEKAQAEIESERAKAQTRLRNETVEMAVEMATGILTKNFNENDNRNAVKEYLLKVGGGK